MKLKILNSENKEEYLDINLLSFIKCLFIAQLSIYAAMILLYLIFEITTTI